MLACSGRIMKFLRSWIKPKRSTLVGVDVGSWSVKLVRLQPRPGGKYKLTALDEKQLPSDAVNDGVIGSPSAIAQTIELLFESNQIMERKIATSVSGSSVIVKKVVLPVKTKAELANAIQWEAQRYVPFETSEVHLDYHVLGPSSGGLEVVLVAAKKEVVADRINLLSLAGRTPVVMDVDAFAVQNAFQVNYQPEPNHVSALLNVGCTILSIHITQGDNFLLTRDIGFGGNRFTQVLREQMSVSFEEAEQYKQGRIPSEELRTQIHGVLARGSQQVGMEIQKTFDYFKTLSGAPEIQDIYLSGGASRTYGLQEHLEEKFKIPVHLLDPFRRIDTDQSGLSEDFLGPLAPDFTVAVGLALRSLRD